MIFSNYHGIVLALRNGISGYVVFEYGCFIQRQSFFKTCHLYEPIYILNNSFRTSLKNCNLYMYYIMLCNNPNNRIFVKKTGKIVYLDVMVSILDYRRLLAGFYPGEFWLPSRLFP
jgi:hypothetical protein